MDKIEKTLAAGGAVVLPTETVYGLFAQALNEEAVERVYELKRRPRDKAPSTLRKKRDRNRNSIFI